MSNAEPTKTATCSICSFPIFFSIDSWFHNHNDNMRCDIHDYDDNRRASPVFRKNNQESGPGVAEYRIRHNFDFFHFEGGEQCFELFQWINQRAPRPYFGYEWSKSTGVFRMTLHSSEDEINFTADSVLVLEPGLAIYGVEAFYTNYERV